VREKSVTSMRKELEKRFKFSLMQISRQSCYHRSPHPNPEAIGQDPSNAYAQVSPWTHELQTNPALGVRI